MKPVSALIIKNRVICFCLLLFFAGNTNAQKAVTHLRAEYRENPMGVDAAKPRFSWELQSPQQNVLQTAWRIVVADDSMLLQKNTGNIWDSKKNMSGASIQVQYNGTALLSAKKYFWKVMVWDNKGNASNWSSIASWQMGLLSAADWKGAEWIAYDQLPDSNKIVPFAHGKGKKEWGTRKDVLPLIRKSFSIARPLKKATAFISGLGHFEMSINGKKTGDHFLDPGWTQYSKHALYVSFDITSQLQQGNNAIGVMLGNGFYYIPGERYRKLTGAYGYPSMICRVLLEYTDGSSGDLLSDDSWKTAPSPIIFSSIYAGEDYDAGLEQTDWNMPGFDDSRWKQVVVTGGPPVLDAQTAEPLKVMEHFAPVKKTLLQPGVWVYDLGQNFSGIPAITVSGRKGDTVKIIPAELINEDGSANQKGSGGPSYYNYILKGNGKESWQPQFTYYGFRYLQVQGGVPGGETNSNQQPVIEKIEGLHIRNAAPAAGNFVSSNKLFNQTYELINWAIKSNTVSVFTDCPHREKLGWLEETQLVGSSVQYNFHIAALNRKVIKDMMNAQTAEGLIPEIAPEYVEFEDPFRDSPEWGSAAIILPWYNYQWYGDKQTLTEAYEMMHRYIGYLQKKAVNHILSQGLGDWYDIGPKRPGVSQLTPMGVTGTATYYYDVTIMKQVATLLGKTADAQVYDQLSGAIKKSFNEKFFNDTTKQYATGSQAANAMALFMGLVDQKNNKAVVGNLVKDIRERNNALTAGDIGYRYVLRTLEEAGRSDVIFDMNSRNDVPGYGYQLAHGATALTESWQAYPSVSNNHFMLGHLMEWFYAGLCGIKQSAGSVGYKEIIIRPQPVGDVTTAKAEYRSPYGYIKTDWKKEGGVFQLRVSIPANTTAAIYLPGSTKAIKTGSGNYSYSVKMK
ncbi:MAG: family 78 glycoside hydrolase catalytic domain [Chitinophagaceae bacterium]